MRRVVNYYIGGVANRSNPRNEIHEYSEWCLNRRGDDDEEEWEDQQFLPLLLHWLLNLFLFYHPSEGRAMSCVWLSPLVKVFCCVVHYISAEELVLNLIIVKKGQNSAGLSIVKHGWMRSRDKWRKAENMRRWRRRGRHGKRRRNKKKKRFLK